MRYPVHPDAALFPLMSDTELAELATDIKVNGLIHPIMLDAVGVQLVDGRNRDRACVIAGVEPRYECLAADVDVFTYIVSTNLHRRHLSDEQKADVVRQVIARHPDKSNREIAKIAKVAPTTIGHYRDQLSSTGQLSSQTIGADGKSRPRAGKYSDEDKAKYMAFLRDNPFMGGREAAEELGISHGTVQRYRRELQGRPPPGVKPASAPMSFPTIAEQLERRKLALPRFDDLSREERGMGTREYGAEQHPDWPEGWTRDDVFRAENGRIQLHTPAEKAVLETRRQCQDITTLLVKLARAFDVMPEIDQLGELAGRDRDDILAMWTKYAPQVAAGVARLMAFADADVALPSSSV